MHALDMTIRHITEKSEPVAYKLNASILQALVHFRPLKGACMFEFYRLYGILWW